MKKTQIEIRYAPGGDENCSDLQNHSSYYIIEIRYAPGGDENSTKSSVNASKISIIEIRYAPGGDENFFCVALS